MEKRWPVGKKILIAGGTGFIGSHLTKKLIDLKAKIILLSRHRPKKLPKEITHISVDLTKEESIKLISEQTFDLIFNLSGETNRINITKLPSVNSLATVHILLALTKKNSKAKLIHLGTRLEYGDSKYLPVDEKHPTVPKDPYSMEKLYSTLLIKKFCNYYSIPYVIFRASNTYGPHFGKNFKNSNLINHYINEAKKGKELVIFGSGRQYRDFIFIDDLVDAFLISGYSAKAEGQIYNVGYGKPIRFVQFISLIAEQAGAKIIRKKWPRSHALIETGDYYANISKISNHLNWYPNISFQEGIRRCF